MLLQHKLNIISQQTIYAIWKWIFRATVTIGSQLQTTFSIKRKMSTFETMSVRICKNSSYNWWSASKIINAIQVGKQQQ